MSKQIFYDRFNENTEELIKDLMNAFPDAPDQFKYFKSGFYMVRNLDPKTPQRIFDTYVSDKYRDYILTKDEAFFLTHDIEVNSHKDYWDEFINYIKGIWRTLDVENKEIIWKYFHVLLVLSDKCKST
jgi:hypothetical protein